MKGNLNKTENVYFLFFFGRLAEGDDDVAFLIMLSVIGISGGAFSPLSLLAVRII